MPNKAEPARPNRVVTCQTCGVQMPQRYFARHMQQHAQAAPVELAAKEALAAAPEDMAAPKNMAAPIESAVVPESVPAQEEAPAPLALDSAPPDQQPASLLTCPACAALVAEADFSSHMQTLHTNWCPLCFAQAKDLADHLRSRHLLKPIQPPPVYEPNWDTQKRFICLGCKKKVSVVTYASHELPHGNTAGLLYPKSRRSSGKK